MIRTDSNIEKEDVRQYLQMLQDIINRMAANSSNCKAWAITLFTAMAALMISVEDMRQWIWIILFPIILFYYLDAYYLGLENGFRNLEVSFLNKLRSSKDYSTSVYEFNHTQVDGYRKWRYFKKGLMSIATWPIYFALVATCIVLYFVFAE